jgi:hydrogenase-4 component B
VLAAVLHTRAEVRPLTPAQQAASAPDRDGDAEQDQAPVPGPRLSYTSDVIEVVETYLYRPAIRPIMAAVRAAKRMQSGRLDAYLAYMLIALVALLALVTALA